MFRSYEVQPVQATNPFRIHDATTNDGDSISSPRLLEKQCRACYPQLTAFFGFLLRSKLLNDNWSFYSYRELYRYVR